MLLLSNFFLEKLETSTPLSSKKYSQSKDAVGTNNVIGAEIENCKLDFRWIVISYFKERSERKERGEMMEPATGIRDSVLQFVRFLPFFVGILLLGTLKGILFCPWICLIMAFGNAAIILGLWPMHCFWTYYSVLRARKLGPFLKLVLCPCIFVLLIPWPVLGIVASLIGGAAYGFLSPIFATFEAVGPGKTDQVFHCILDGTWGTVKGCFTIVRDFKDVCYYSYLSFMDDLQRQEPVDGRYYEIRVLYLPGAVLASTCGVLLDVPIISLVALFKSPYMLFKGWHRLIHDLIGREGPFLETICVPFAGLAILLWPLAVIGAVLASIITSAFLGAYAGVVAYQESSLCMGLRYTIACLAIFDEYSNDVLDMPEGTCFPRPDYWKNATSRTPSRASSFSRPDSVHNPPSRTVSLKNSMLELKPLELYDGLFMECKRHGEQMVSGGLISLKDIEDAKSKKDGNGVISIGLPAYCILQSLLRSIKANSLGILLSDNITEITSSNRPKDVMFDWFLNPLLIIKDQIKAENLSTDEEAYLGQLVLLSGNPDRLESMYPGRPPESEVKRAELDALARRLRGITKSISRYPTYRRRFGSLTKTILEELEKRNGGGQTSNGSLKIRRTRSSFLRIVSQNSLKRKYNSSGSDMESNWGLDRDVEIQ